MHTIEVDFDVLKALTALRPTESVSNNDVIRGLLKLPGATPQPKEPAAAVTGDWIVKGVRFAAGTELRGKYQGREHTARVGGGALVLNGQRYVSPSHAASSITGYAVNGWNFWQVRNGDSWRPMSSYRKS
jgi:hypothetical protein